MGDEIKIKQQQSYIIKEQMQTIISNYEQKVLELQLELLKNIQVLKNGLNAENTEEKSKILEKGKGLK